MFDQNWAKLEWPISSKGTGNLMETTPVFASSTVILVQKVSMHTNPQALTNATALMIGVVTYKWAATMMVTKISLPKAERMRPEGVLAWGKGEGDLPPCSAILIMSGLVEVELYL